VAVIGVIVPVLFHRHLLLRLQQKIVIMVKSAMVSSPEHAAIIRGGKAGSRGGFLPGTKKGSPAELTRREIDAFS
jgi:hypothetical protein